MRSIFLLLLSVYGLITFAHEVNKAYFNFTVKDHLVEVEAEFPWTMRNALLNFNPKLENSSNKQDFEDSFTEYIRQNLILKSSNGSNLELISFKELERKGHGHQNNYLIVFEGQNLFEITNTIMFNLYNNQVNFNSIKTGSSERVFETTKGSKYFTLNKEQHSSYWYLLILTIPLAYILKRFLNK